MSASLEFLEVRERFLPVKLAGLRERMLRDPRLSAAERKHLGKLFRMIVARFHFEFREKLEHLKTVYGPFDPDCDTIPTGEAAEGGPPQPEELARAFEELLLGANYVEMPREQVVACAEHHSQTGLVVSANFSNYAQLRVFHRGVRRRRRTFRPWLTPWRRRAETVHVFSRVALLVRLAGPATGPVFLKLFKNVVAEDLEMLLPHVRIRMRPLDHLKIGSSLAGGAATAAWKALTAAILSWWVFLLVMSGFVGACVRGVFSFVSSKTRYMQALTNNLYFQNLANNTSALAHLVDTAEAEECKELLLAYYMLYVEHDRDYTQEELDRRVEQWLQAEFDLDVDFEVPDAVRKLLDKGIVVRRPAAQGAPAADGVLKVYDLPSTLRRLDKVWDEYFSYNGTLAPEEDRLADAVWPPRADRAAGQAEAGPVRRTDAAQPPLPARQPDAAARREAP